MDGANMQQESIYIDDQNHKLHIRHIRGEKPGIPVLMVHGAIENGKIFYTETGHGLGCFLAEEGFDVYILDLRGRGKSMPLINAESDFGQHEIITHDLPLVIDYIFKKTKQSMHLVSHSWGGVLLASVMVRHPEIRPLIRSNTCFGTKRTISVSGIEKFFKVNLLWNNLALKLAKKKGFFDAKKYGIGSDSETIKSLQHSVAWVKKGPWHDPQDGFDYQAASTTFEWPPTWHLTGINDKVLGHIQDVQNFVDESLNKHAKVTLLSKQSGNLCDYDHIDILTHKLARKDHFPAVAKWLTEH